MPINLDITKSFFYQDGFKEGEIKGERIGELPSEEKKDRDNVLYLYYQERLPIETISRYLRI